MTSAIPVTRESALRFENPGCLRGLRYDQLMNIGWKIAIPVGMPAVLINAVLGMIRHPS